MVNLDIEFGFDDPNFSDRTLLLQIIGEDDGVDVDRSHRLRNKKHSRRSDDLFNKHSSFSEPTQREKTIHIASLILAARSPFFRKFFSNGMQESKQKHVTLQIEASEEVSFMDLLKYIYSNNLPTSLDALLDLSMIADKFEFDSCTRDITQALQNMAMTCDSASVYLDLPPSLPIFSTFQPLIEASKNFLVAKFKDLSTSKEELLNLSLPNLETLLCRDDLQVTSEFDVYDFVLTWAHKHYPDLEDRREILKTDLLHLIRFPFMTKTQLTEKVQSCSDIDPEFASKIVHQAICFKFETDAHRKRCRLAAVEGNAASRQFVERAYIYRPVKVVELEWPHPKCVVYFNLTRNELKCILPEGGIRSEVFHLDDRELKLCVQRNLNEFGFLLFLDKLESSTCRIKYEFAIRKQPKESFEVWSTGSHEFTNTEFREYLCPKFEWDRFISDDNPYFVNDIYHMRFELTIMQ